MNGESEVTVVRLKVSKNARMYIMGGRGWVLDRKLNNF
jgi:hypothetical protein